MLSEALTDLAVPHVASVFGVHVDHQIPLAVRIERKESERKDDILHFLYVH